MRRRPGPRATFGRRSSPRPDGLKLPARLLAVAFVALALVGCAQSEATVRIGPAKTHPLVADTLGEQVKGLQGHSSADVARGMLFVWDEEDVRRFALKGVEDPLDLVYFDADGTVLEIGTLAPGGPTESMSAHPAQYVLEIEAGWADEHGIKAGDRGTVVLGR